MPEAFAKTFPVRWSDVDFNGHMRNTAYLDLCVDVRMMYFAEHGFAMREFERLRFGPVVMKDEIEYFRELRLLETVTVTFELVSVNAEASRFSLRNEFFNAGSKLVARVTSTGGWLDLNTRKLTAPPEQLAAVMKMLPRSQDYTDIV